MNERIAADLSTIPTQGKLHEHRPPDHRHLRPPAAAAAVLRADDRVLPEPVERRPGQLCEPAVGADRGAARGGGIHTQDPRPEDRPGEGLTVFLVEFRSPSRKTPRCGRRLPLFTGAAGLALRSSRSGASPRSRARRAFSATSGKIRPASTSARTSRGCRITEKRGSWRPCTSECSRRTRTGEPIESKQAREAEQLFEAWKDRIPEQVRGEILAYFSGARARLGEICEEIAKAYPQVGRDLEEIQEQSEAAFFSLTSG